MNVKTGFIVLASTVAIGCADAAHPVAPAAVPAAPATSASFSVAPAQVANLSAGINDAVDRLLPSIGSGENVTALRASLEAISTAVAAGDAAAAADAVAAARAGIAAVAAEKGDAAAADLGAISLALGVVSGSIISSN
jgi:hypothetical protein